jgi:hypothetical protein
VPVEVAVGAISALEGGAVLFFPRLKFSISSGEGVLFSPSLATGKNVSFDPATARVRGAAAGAEPTELLRGFLQRFSDAASTLAEALLRDYREALERGRASFRPAEIAGRATSWRQDDRRLHIDSFPATPVHGRRILRIFTNVNPEDRPRSWRIGEDFDRVANRFANDLRLPIPGTASLRRLFGLTKSRRSAYDALMLQLHDRMKADDAYQLRLSSRVDMDGVHRSGEPRGDGRPVSARTDVASSCRGHARA